jgi:hypothetical protein
MGADHRRILRLLLLADAILIVIAASMTIFIDPQIVPPELKKYAEVFSPDLDSSEKLGVVIVVALILVINFVSIAGLWFLQRWARILYTLAFIAGLVISALSEPDVHSGILSAIQDMDTGVTGAVLLLVWFIMKDEFARPSR